MSIKFSNIFVIFYLASTLFLRIMIEPQLGGRYALSIVFGLFAIIFLLALIKSKFIRPTLWGLDRFWKSNEN